MDKYLWMVFCFGLVLGSFYNVLIYRLPGDLDLKGERSMCPHCMTVLRFWDLIPVISWLILRGRCRYCKGRISFQYPLVEIASALFALLAFRKYGLRLEAVLSYVFMSASLIIAFTDVRTQTIPDKITIPILVIFLIASPFRISINQPYHLNIMTDHRVNQFFNAVLSALTCGGFLLLLAELSNGKMGGGDIKYIAAVGAYLGWYQTVIVLLFGSILGLIGTFVLIKLGKASRKQPIPFGPYLAAAGIIVSNISINAIIFPH